MEGSLNQTQCPASSKKCLFNKDMEGGGGWGRVGGESEDRMFCL